MDLVDDVLDFIFKLTNNYYCFIVCKRWYYLLLKSSKICNECKKIVKMNNITLWYTYYYMGFHSCHGYYDNLEHNYKYNLNKNLYVVRRCKAIVKDAVLNGYYINGSIYREILENKLILTDNIINMPNKLLKMSDFDYMAANKKFFIVVLYADWCRHSDDMKIKLGYKMYNSNHIIFCEQKTLSNPDYFPHVLYYEDGKRKKDLSVQDVYLYLL